MVVGELAIGVLTGGVAVRSWVTAATLKPAVTRASAAKPAMLMTSLGLRGRMASLSCGRSDQIN